MPITITSGKRYSIRYFELPDTSGLFRPRNKTIFVNKRNPINARELLFENRRIEEIRPRSKYKKLPE
jgi:hypothetical protein